MSKIVPEQLELVQHIVGDDFLCSKSERNPIAWLRVPEKKKTDDTKD